MYVYIYIYVHMCYVCMHYVYAHRYIKRVVCKLDFHKTDSFQL